VSAVKVLEPVLDGGIENTNFFNGRLLTAEDLKAEQKAGRLHRRKLGCALGEGVAWGSRSAWRLTPRPSSPACASPPG